jgi:hypothetical protein
MTGRQLLILLITGNGYLLSYNFDWLRIEDERRWDIFTLSYHPDKPGRS